LALLRKALEKRAISAIYTQNSSKTTVFGLYTSGFSVSEHGFLLKTMVSGLQYCPEKP
jgi:hypothetical protein